MRISRTMGLGAALVAIAAIAVQTAHGGMHEIFPSTVVISMSNRTATGAMAAVRASSDTRQNIGCVEYTTYSGGSPNQFLLGCSAIDSAGTSVTCFFPSNLNYNAVYPISSINADSYISFSWDASSNCTSVEVNNHSLFQPKPLL